MNRLTRHALIATISLLTALRIGAQGYLVPNGVSTNVFPDEFTVWNPGTQITGFMLSSFGVTQPPGYTNAFRFMEPVTIGVRVFLVSMNDPFSLSQIQASAYSELIEQGIYVFEPDTPLFVGLYTGANIEPPYPPVPPYTYSDPVFGWAQLVNTDGTIVLLDYALAHQAAGIIAGTETILQIPEPTAAALLVLGLITMVWHRRLAP